MIDVTLPEGLLHWLTSNPDLAYFLAFIVISLGFYGLYPFTIGLGHAASSHVPSKNLDIGKQIRKPHRLAITAAAIVSFAVLHFGLSMPLFAMFVGMALLAVLMVVDHVQIWRDYPRGS